MKLGPTLCIETSDDLCSVSLYINVNETYYLESEERKSHGKNLNIVIREIISKAGIKFNDLKYVAVSSGPGSYTGLRIGASTAKGICYALGIPLIAIDAFDILRQKFIETNPAKDFKNLTAMIDARRMEVYACSWDNLGKRKYQAKAVVLEEEGYGREYAVDEFFIGNGAAKLKLEESSKQEVYSDIFPNAKAMLSLSLVKVENSSFEDLVYFEPFYLKEFYVTKARNLISIK